jgi:eukaryotic-like serine/threonine-protein kinase
MPCLSDAVIAALAEHRLPERERVPATHHLETCETCQGVLALLQSRDDNVSGPKKIDRFVVLKTLGQGAMGVVYLAYDAKLERRVAIKVLDATDPGVEARIEREARTLARLNHPNIVAVYDVGLHDEQVYMTMEFVNGVTLRAWLAEKRSQEEILEVFNQAGEGLKFAHGAGVVHRDFKPDNVLIGRDRRVRVVDFGLAQSGRRADSFTMPLLQSALTSVTRTGHAVGTPAYMAPEQILAGVVDARTDQFAFAIALAEALYGTRPFPGRTFEELSDSVSRGDIRLPLDNASIHRVLRRCLATKKDDRYPDMSALLLDLHTAAIATTAQTKRARVLRLAAGAAAVLGFALVALLSLRGPNSNERSTYSSAVSTATAPSIEAPPGMPRNPEAGAGIVSSVSNTRAADASGAPSASTSPRNLRTGRTVPKSNGTVAPVATVGANGAILLP